MIFKLVLVITTVASLLILETKFPFFTFTNSLRARIGNNLELGAINSIISSLSTIAIANFVVFDRNSPGIFVTISSPIIVGILAFLILDLYMYCWHQSMHILPLAWRFHRVHHTDRSMNVSTAYRFHPIEIVSSSLPKLCLIWWLGIPSQVVLIYELVFTAIVALHHSNVRIPQSIERSLGYIIVTPSSHRIHHSQIVTETNSNYGSVFIWWDRLFGTSQSRPDPEHIQLGIADDETKELNLWQSLLLPISPAER
jgi:sterol desaturase/sphingolipid hydroxylase (fatty acid hydroxylase superfamily)